MRKSGSVYDSAPAKTRKAIDAYYASLREYAHQQAFHEGAVSVAFQTLLADAARTHQWTLIPQLSSKVSTSKAGRGGIRPDGTLKDNFNTVRGHWEAKDTNDDLDTEIKKKFAKGYPLTNIIFEDTRHGVLFQNGQKIQKYELQDKDQLADLLKQFFAYIEPHVEEFEHAVDEFKTRVPDLALGLKTKIEEAHATNRNFKVAFARFFQLCQTSLNPDITEPVVNDMLVQHLLTERLIREIFDNPEFIQRNVIAAEIEKVIAALTSKSFNRDTFLKSLDRFYIAIENAARTITDYADKQHFLNTVYERFFQGYSVNLADTMGIVYTPQPIVDFMCASVAEVLEKEFGKSLGDKDVYLLDPCTGTGNFIVNLIRRIPKKDLPRVYRDQLFANEVMLLPYYIAALNIEHAYYEQTGEYAPFEGLCFTDTLDLTDEAQTKLSFINATNAERVNKQRRSPITVIIGNPPWNVGQADENDNNKNRAYGPIDKRIRNTYVKDSSASLHTKLYDAYMKFFRWASDRLVGPEGIVAFVSNNGFLHGVGFDGFRAHLARDFTDVYHFNFKGNARTSGSRRKEEGGNVFNDQIRAGVGVTVLVRRNSKKPKTIRYHEVGNGWDAERKLGELQRYPTLGEVPWRHLERSSSGDWVLGELIEDDGSSIPLASKESRSASVPGKAKTVFKRYSLGVSTNRDRVAYSTSKHSLLRTVEAFVESYNAEVSRYARKRPAPDVDDFVDYTKVKWSQTLKVKLTRGTFAEFSESRVRQSLYRPFDKRWLYYDGTVNDRPGQFAEFLPLERDNQVLVISDLGFRASGFSALLTDLIPDLHLCAAVDAHQCFPFYVYDEDGTNRRENITDWARDQFHSRYKDKTITKWDIFHYVYGLLHHPGYRTKFAENLKRELPRIPFAPTPRDFRAFADAGNKLSKLHVGYESVEPYNLKWEETPGVPLSYRVEKMSFPRIRAKGKPSEIDRSRLKINDSLTLAGIPPETYDYRLGNRSALEWVIDQYQVERDDKGNITSDPNRDDDEQYIVNLVGRVVRVSVDTVRIVKSLPADFGA